jgi:hypothetical protein
VIFHIVSRPQGSTLWMPGMNIFEYHWKGIQMIETLFFIFQ